VIGLYNRDEKCFLCGTNWVFKYGSLCFICKGLMTHSHPCHQLPSQQLDQAVSCTLIICASLHYQCNAVPLISTIISKKPDATISYSADEGVTFLQNTVAYQQTFVAHHLRKQ
jgi:hypothetical protein